MPDIDEVGLCRTCAHSRRVPGARTTFYLCERSFTDTRFRKYPPLPVLRCIGYDAAGPAAPSEHVDDPRDIE
jgi:hypothetical protein